MKFVTATAATFDTFFKGQRSLTFAHDVTEAAIRRHIDQEYYGGNWKPDSLVLTSTKLKEKVFEATCVKL